MQWNVQLASLAALTELVHRHGAFIEMIHRDLLVAEINGFGHVVGDTGRQIGVAKKGPAAKVHSVNIPVHLRVVFPRQHGAGKADFFHFAQNGIVEWQESHAGIERGGAPAFHTFVEDGVGSCKADCVIRSALLGLAACITLPPQCSMSERRIP